MATQAGKRIAAALQELVDAAVAGVPLEQRFTVRNYSIDAEPAKFDSPAVRALRDSYGMSQGVLANFLCVSPATIKSWEQGQRVPARIARRLLGELPASPDHFRLRFAKLARIKPAPAHHAEPRRPAASKVRSARKAPVEA